MSEVRNWVDCRQVQVGERSTRQPGTRRSGQEVSPPPTDQLGLLRLSEAGCVKSPMAYLDEQA